jgi:hypothetical protein
MTSIRFSPTEQTMLEARYAAQKIAFGPVVFQCLRYAQQRGLLAALAEAGDDGVSVEALAERGPWSRYAIKLTLESCLSAGVVSRVDGRYRLDKVGYCVLSDRMTQVNLAFVDTVCYRGLADLAEALDREQPVGLATLGSWPTVYQGLSELPEPARSDWFAFDHLYSDTSFPEILGDVFRKQPKRLMDIGGNTGKFGLAALAHDPTVSLHVVDLPQQLAIAATTFATAGVGHRTHLHGVDLLDPTAPLPGGMDLIWMSQFLSCFSEAAIGSILRRAVAALADGGEVLILDTLWDRQRHEIAAYCLINTSPYFTAIASGTSKVYESADYIRLARDAGLVLVGERDHIGYCHSLLRFARG